MLILFSFMQIYLAPPLVVDKSGEMFRNEYVVLAETPKSAKIIAEDSAFKIYPIVKLNLLKINPILNSKHHFFNEGSNCFLISSEKIDLGDICLEKFIQEEMLESSFNGVDPIIPSNFLSERFRKYHSTEYMGHFFSYL